ncbi:MAG TPA: hypothetical protein VNL71_07690 [Chloroflexota bacterium]|nr:hypothetical protein [Chloroflexota bacterium]
MKKSTTALASLAVAAAITGGTAVTAQAHPAYGSERMVAHHTSSVALTRLQALLHAPSSADRAIRPNDGGSLGH